MRALVTTIPFLFSASAYAGQLAVAPIGDNEASRFFHVYLDVDGEPAVFASKVQAFYVAEFDNDTLLSLEFNSGLPEWIGAEVVDADTTLTLSHLDGDGFTIRGIDVAFPEVWSEPIVATSVQQTAPLEWQLSVDGPWENTSIQVADGITLERFGFFAQDVAVGVPEPTAWAIASMILVSFRGASRKMAADLPR